MSEFFIGGFCSVIAEVLTLPMDTVKVRLQLEPGISLIPLINKMMSEEGPLSLFNGAEPAIIRQIFYGSLRYGLYPLFQSFLKPTNGKVLFFHKLLAGCLAGAISSAICNPTDLIKVRMQASHRTKLKLKIEDHNSKSQFEYRNVFHGLSCIVKDEGFIALFTGVFPTMARASVVAMVEMASYDQIKPLLVSTLDYSPSHPLIHILTALCASFLTSFISNPLDVLRSRLMNQPINPKTKKGLIYSSLFDCAIKSIGEEGWGVLWAGFWAFFLRLGPNTILVFVLMERLREFLSSSSSSSS